jgi:hypothetical protein
MPNKLTAALKSNKTETENLVKAAPLWSIASTTFDAFFKKMSNPKDDLWSEAFIKELHSVYLKARDKDKKCANITVRTVNAMPKSKANDTKKVMLEIANACRVFHAAHKVNFEPDELPQNFNSIPMVSAKKNGVFTYKEEVPSLYAKTSLTFDYWVPKILDWTIETREKKIKEWKNGSALQLEACTDFMSVCLQFLSDPKNNIPIAKAEDREAFLKIFGEEFTWIKKSARREDIDANSSKIKTGLLQLNKETGIVIPLEAWSRLQQASFIKSILK